MLPVIINAVKSSLGICNAILSTYNHAKSQHIAIYVKHKHGISIASLAAKVASGALQKSTCGKTNESLAVS